MRCSKCYMCDTLFLRCLFYVLKFLGVAPMSIKTSRASEKSGPQGIQFVSSKLGILYNGILSFLTIYPSYLMIRYYTSPEYIKNLELENIVDEAQSTFAMITSTFIIVNVCVRQKKAVKLANQLSSVHRAVMDLANDVGDSVGPNTIIILCVKKIVLINLATTIVWIASSPPSDYQNLIYFIIMSLYNIIIHAMLLQYSLVLKLLHQLYRSVNADIMALLTESSISSDNNVHLILKRLRQLRQIYVTLCRTSRDVSDFYSLPMLLCVTHVFLTLIIYNYYIIMTLIVWNIYEKPILVVLNCVTLVTLLAVSMTILARTAGVTVVESKATGGIVSEWIDNCENHEVVSQLKGFSNYLLHKDVRFSVFDLFPLNESLLISIVGSITTYLVILLQFEEDPTNKGKY